MKLLNQAESSLTKPDGFSVGPGSGTIPEVPLGSLRTPDTLAIRLVRCANALSNSARYHRS